MNQSSLNGTGNQSPGDRDNVPMIIFVILLFVSGILALTNMSYIIVCFRIFSKEFNRLLVLCLCLSGTILGFSTVWYSLMEIFRSILLTPLACSLAIFLGTFGLFMSYSFLCILNLANFFIVKAYNFGVYQKLNRIKFPLFSGVIICSFFLASLTWLIPRKPVIKACGPDPLYGDDLITFLAIFQGTLSIMLIATIVTSVLTILQIYFKFFQTNPHQNKLFFRRNHVGVQEAHKVEFKRFKPTDDSTKPTTSNDHTIHCITNGNNPTTKISVEVYTTSSCNNTIPREKNSSHQTTFHSPGRDMKGKQINNYTKEIEHDHSPKHQISGPHACHSPSRQNVRPVWMSWEKKAFITNLLITASTVLLTGPLTCMNIAIIALGKVPVTAGFVTFILFHLNSAISPFIYAWRIPELRQQFKNICKKN